jgi:hypothetical protein
MGFVAGGSLPRRRKACCSNDLAHVSPDASWNMAIIFAGRAPPAFAAMKGILTCSGVLDNRNALQKRLSALSLKTKVIENY